MPKQLVQSLINVYCFLEYFLTHDSMFRQINKIQKTMFVFDDALKPCESSEFKG